MSDTEKFVAKATQVFGASFAHAHKRYMDLMGRCESLTPEECKEFAQVSGTLASSSKPSLNIQHPK
jgi:hypothetical protein